MIVTVLVVFVGLDVLESDHCYLLPTARRCACWYSYGKTIYCVVGRLQNEFLMGQTLVQGKPDVREALPASYILVVYSRITVIASLHFYSLSRLQLLSGQSFKSYF